MSMPPEFWWSTDILSSIFLQGVDQKILLCGQGRIDSVKTNPSLLTMRECKVFLLSGDIATIFQTLSPSSSVGGCAAAAFKREAAQVYNSAGEASLPWEKHPQQI